jgi:NADH-quinone oxidoreductase subunit L
VITAGITSFYMFRLIFLTFHGVSRVEPEKEHHVHDSPPVMAIPLIVLAVLATVGDFVGLPDGLLWGNSFRRFLAPVFAHPVGSLLGVPTIMTEVRGASGGLALSATALAAGLLGMFFAWLLYIQSQALPGRIAENLHGPRELLWRKCYIDELYDHLISRPLF